MKSLTIISLFAYIFSVFFCSCTTEKKKLIVLFDVSSSIDSNVTNQYCEKMHTIMQTMKTHDAVVVYPIHGGSIASCTPIMEINFYKEKSAYEVSGLNKAQTDQLRKLAFEKYIDKKIVQFKSSLSQLDKEGMSNNTNIIGSLEIASKCIQESKSLYSKQSVLVLSDMEQYADKGVKFKKNFDAQACNQLSNSISPDLSLSGVNIAVVTGAQKMDEYTYKNIQTFWVNYFQKSNANLIAYVAAQNDGLDKLFIYEK